MVSGWRCCVVNCGIYVSCHTLLASIFGKKSHWGMLMFCAALDTDNTNTLKPNWGVATLLNFVPHRLCVPKQNANTQDVSVLGGGSTCTSRCVLPKTWQLLICRDLMIWRPLVFLPSKWPDPKKKRVVPVLWLTHHPGTNHLRISLCVGTVCVLVQLVITVGGDHSNSLGVALWRKVCPRPPHRHAEHIRRRHGLCTKINVYTAV